MRVIYIHDSGRRSIGKPVDVKTVNAVIIHDKNIIVLLLKYSKAIYVIHGRHGVTVMLELSPDVWHMALTEPEKAYRTVLQETTRIDNNCEKYDTEP